MTKLIAYIIVATVTALIAMLNGWIIAQLWGWFILPAFGIACSLKTAIGIDLILSLITIQHIPRGKEVGDLWPLAKFVVMMPLSTFLIGAFVHWAL